MLGHCHITPRQTTVGQNGHYCPQHMLKVFKKIGLQENLLCRQQLALVDCFLGIKYYNNNCTLAVGAHPNIDVYMFHTCCPRIFNALCF